MKKKEIPEMYKLETPFDVDGVFVIENKFDSYMLHRHDFYEFEYIIEGEGVCEINGKSFLFRKGDVSFVTPLDLHSYRGEQTFKTVTVHFHLETISPELASLSGMEACVINCTEEMKRLFLLLQSEFSEKEHKRLSLKNIIELIVIMFLRINKCERTSDTPREMLDIIGYINQNFTKPIDLSGISKMCNYSTAYLSRQFKKYTGMGFSEYLVDVRVSHAKNILMNNDISITQLAYECGFGCVRSFNRAFFAKYGCSPKEYKGQNLS